MSAQRDVLVMAADGVTLDGPVSAQRAVWVETKVTWRAVSGSRPDGTCKSARRRIWRAR